MQKWQDTDMTGRQTAFQLYIMNSLFLCFVKKVQSLTKDGIDQSADKL